MANKVMEIVNNGGAIRAYDGMIVVWPQMQEEPMKNVQETITKFNGRHVYEVNNSTVSFILETNMYVAPYTRKLMKALEEDGYTEKSFYVPFSNGDYPKHEKQTWTFLREKARLSYKDDFVSDCKAYCDERHIGSISEETLANCFQMPENGVRVKHPSFETTYYPFLNEVCLDCRCDNLGHYCYNNGRVVFIYRNGHTYVAKGYRIISELRDAGYTEFGLFVPFSNGEVILDPILFSRWESITK